MTQGARSKATVIACVLALAVNCILGATPAVRAQTQDSDTADETKREPQAVRDEMSPGSGAPIVLLQGLDKITARVSTFEAPVGQMVQFGTLQITARHCNKRPPTEPPESAAFLEILDQHSGAGPVKLFIGWMFASSPALSGLEHPVYDVWVLDCLTATGSGEATPGTE